MKQTVNAGMFSNVYKFIKGLSDMFSKFIDSLGDYGLDIVESEQLEGNGVYFKIKFNNDYAEIVAYPVEGKDDVFNVRVKAPSIGTKELKNIQGKDIQSKVMELLSKGFKTDFSENSDDDINEVVENSKQLKVTLQKVNAASDSYIKLKAITANYDMLAATGDLYSLLDNDEFASSIPEEPTSYDIYDSGDSFEVEETEGPLFDVYNSIYEIMTHLLNLWSNVKLIHWASKGDNFNDLHSVCEECAYTALYQLDYYGELAMELCDTVTIPDIHPDVEILNRSGGDACFDSESGFSELRGQIETVIAILDVLYVNFDHNVQSVIDEHINYWRKQANYFIKQRLK